MEKWEGLDPPGLFPPPRLSVATPLPMFRSLRVSLRPLLTALLHGGGYYLSENTRTQMSFTVLPKTQKTFVFFPRLSSEEGCGAALWLAKRKPTSQMPRVDRRKLFKKNTQMASVTLETLPGDILRVAVEEKENEEDEEL
ncbi:hypothetical protein E2C01_046737 [Portunus trituberculatus]|uniref:Uncharacterized protein n=1 Tax=Portunus trituberculatus TaxID=210409 RepID=A0A5B7G6Z5_PORTR|nr:hypothetical protein [Portunus trituberculatus]